MSRTAKADGRMISSSISTDARVARLSSWKGRLLFLFMIPHGDDQGRLAGDPTEVRLRAVPLEPEISDEDVAQSLQEMHDLGLITWYEVKGRRIIQIRGWWNNQDHMRRKYPSSYPAPEGWRDWLRYRVRAEGRTRIIEQGSDHHGFPEDDDERMTDQSRPRPTTADQVRPCPTMAAQGRPMAP